MKRSLALGLTLAAVVLGVLGCTAAADFVSKNALSTGPNGPETPASLGVPFERVSIMSHSRRLDGYLVRAPADCRDPPAILIYHGFNETISYWVDAQRLLYRHCVSSLVFDPTGSGDSTRPASLHRLAEDTVSAYGFARSAFPPPVRLYVMGHSMGDALMLQAEPALRPQPSGVIVANGFSSVRDFWAVHGVSKVVLQAMPDWWDNVRAIAAVHVPVLVVHSDADREVPVEEAQRVYAAAAQPKQIAILHGVAHNGLRRHLSEAWWTPVLGFVGSPGLTRAPLRPPPQSAGEVSAHDAEVAREAEILAGAAALAAPSSAQPAAGLQTPPGAPP